MFACSPTWTLLGTLTRLPMRTLVSIEVWRGRRVLFALVLDQRHLLPYELRSDVRQRVSLIAQFFSL